MTRLKKYKKKLALSRKRRMVKRMKDIRLVSAVWREGKYYVARCLNVEVSSFGATRAKALRNLKEALELYFEDGLSSKVVKIEKPSFKVQQLLNA